MRKWCETSQTRLDLIRLDTEKYRRGRGDAGIGDVVQTSDAYRFD
jgi:hypothetical protein